MLINILVADDEKLIRKAVIARLKREFDMIGEIHEAEDGQQAINILEKKSIDIVITDIRMPVVDGIEIVRHIYKNMDKSIKSVIISGYAEFEYAERAINYGVSGYLLKPIQKNEFNETMHKVITEVQEDKVWVEKVEPKKQEQLLNNLFVYGQKEVEASQLFADTENLNSYALLLVHVDGISYLNSQFAFDDTTLLKFSVMNVIKEMIEESRVFCMNSNIDGNTIMVLIGDENKTALDAYINRVSVGIIYNVKKYLDTSITIGISTAKSEINQIMYNEAAMALDSRYIIGKGKIYYYDDHGIVEYHEYAKKKMPLLQKTIEQKEKENIGRIIRSFFHDFEKEFKKPSFVRLLVRDILALVHKENYKHLDTYGYIEPNQFVHKLIKNCNDLKDIEDKLISYCQEIMTSTHKNLKKDIIQDISNYVKEHYNEEIFLEDLATRYNLSSNYIYTLMKQEMGMSYKQYLKSLRLNEAKRLLKESEIPITDISQICGYNDSLYFSRLFKKETGMSPSMYRTEGNKE